MSVRRIEAGEALHTTEKGEIKRRRKYFFRNSFAGSDKVFTFATSSKQRE